MDRPFKRAEMNTYTQDTESALEMARLEAQVNWVQDGMQGVIFPPDGKTLPPSCHDVVDLACGTGAFARHIANMSTREHPVVVQRMDISKLMISHARGMSQDIPHVHFEIGNILSPLKYADASFDMVNANLLFSVLKRDAWKPFLTECFRISRPEGNCYDNAVTESFFGTVKDECVHRTVYHSQDEARQSLFEYLEVFYNRQRRHSSLGYLSPAVFEQQWELRAKNLAVF